MLDKLITNVMTIAELKALYIETFLNHTSKVSKITDLSVLNAHAFGVAKIFQKDFKDAAITESLMFPELSSGAYLDSAAKSVGGMARLQAAGSSTFVLVHAAPGTVYVPGRSSFASNQGVTFSIVELTTVGDNGYAYVKARSTSVGKGTNVGPLTINSMTQPPLGHISCTNEYGATGGRDTESDEDFKSRLSTFQQFAATGSYQKLLADLRTMDADIIDTRRAGYTDSGRILISLVTCNGKSYSQDELMAFEQRMREFLSLSDVDDQAGVIGLELQNVEWHQVGGSDGVDFRVDIASGYTQASVRKSIQIQLTKYFDFRFWGKTKVEWDDLLQIVKGVKGVKYVPDEFFKPHADAAVDARKLPRVIKFVMRDMAGSILYDNNGSVLPIYYTT